MSKSTLAVSAAGPMLIYLGARVFDLDLGWFGIGLLIAGAALGVASILTPSQGDAHHG